MINLLTMSDEEIADRVEQGSYAPYELPELCTLLSGYFFPKAAVSALLRARNENTTSMELWLRLANQQLASRNLVDAANTLLILFQHADYIYFPILDQLINQILWAGQHDLAEALYRHQSGMLFEAVFREDGYYRDAFLTYAAECSPKLVKELLAHLETRDVTFAYEDQLPNIAENQFAVSGFNYSGNTALITFLHYAGCRVDSIGDYWGNPIEVDVDNVIRERLVGASDYTHYFLNRAFIFRKHIRCVNYAHRKPNYRLGAQKCIYITRDPRSAFATWFRPSLIQLQTGMYRRLVAINLQYWNDFITSFSACTDAKLLRFEDWKADGEKTAKEVCEFVGLTVRDSQFQEALLMASSNLDRAIKTRNTGTVRYSDWELAKLDSEHQRLMAETDELIVQMCGPGMRLAGYI